MFDQHPELVELQKKLAVQVKVPSNGEGYLPVGGSVGLGLDIQYEGDQGHVAGHLFRWKGDPIGTYAGVMEVNVPYVPSYFCFREGPPLLAFIERLKKESLPEIDFIIVDGHGLAHPRKFGVACWLGIATGKPTVGIAKKSLLKMDDQPEEAEGSTAEVKWEEEVVGFVVRTKEKVKPVYASPGHLVDMQGSIDVALGLPGEHRVSDPIRHADHAARAHAKGQDDKSYIDLGTLAPVATPWE